MRLRLTIPLLVLTFSATAHAQNEQLYKRVEQSVVKISTTDSRTSATGFVWGTSSTVVTALHVVDGSSNIRVNYPAQGVTRVATVQRVLKNADLVLLDVSNAPNVPVLPSSTAAVTTDDDLHTLGFPFDAAAISSFMLKARYGGRRLADNVSSAVVTRIQRNGYPDPNLQVLKLGQESLLPGLSGAPIFNGRGEVVAIGDGGLEEGAINISWAIPAEHLNTLRTSGASATPRGPGTRELFAADLDMAVGKTINANGVSLVKVRTRTLTELAASADDQLGLQQLAAVFANFGPASFSYDIYQDIETGATIVLPEGSSLTPGDPFWNVVLPTSMHDHDRYQIKLVFTRLQPGMIQGAALQFEESLKDPPSIVWQIDPQWSYAMPLSRYDGLVVRRKAVYGGQFGPGGFSPAKYLFETLAGRGDAFVGLAVVNTDSTPATIMREMSCRQPAECPSLFESRRTWAQLVLGLQMTSFAH